MRESVPTARYSPVCNVLRQWKTSLILTYRVYRLYDNYIYGRSEQEARERKEILRRSVKDVAYCDIEDDPPITTKYPGLFDIIIETGALASVHSQDVFERGVAKLAALLKPGGTLLMITLICHQNNYFTEYSYFNGKYEHFFFPVSSGYVRSVLIGEARIP